MEEKMHTQSKFMLGGLAGGTTYLTTPLDVIKTRFQVQGSTLRYNDWLDSIGRRMDG